MTGLSSEILFEKFQIIEVLKKDEHAAVFLANHIYLSKKIILKVLNTQKISDQALVERFKREAKILAQLDSPHIIKVLDFGMFKEYFYISFEYIEGVSLRNLLKQQQISLEQKNHLMVQLLKGLSYAHQCQIIHRDIKPENIFVDNNLNLKIGDFGLALSAEDNFVTNPYSIVGTPSYMSPEQVRGAKLNAQSDLFSAGIVIYEIFTGKNPFLKENVNLTLNEIMAFDEGVISKGLFDQEQKLQDVVYNLIRKNPKDRYTTALEALNDLGVTIDQPTLVIKADETYQQKNKIKGIAAIVTMVVILSAWGIIFFMDKADQPSNANTILQNPTKQEIEPLNQNDSSIPNKEQVDTSTLNKPLIDKPAESNQTQSNVEQNSISQTNKPIRFGSFDIRCNVGTKVFIDGEEIITTPIDKPIRLEEGTHTLRLVHPEYPPYTTQIEIKPSEILPFRFNMDSTVGYISCDTRPSGKVFINNSLIGYSPTRLVKVQPGGINVKLTKEGFKDIDTSFYVKAGDTIRLHLPFKK